MKEITNLKKQIADLDEQLEIDIQNSKPTLKLKFLTAKELVDTSDPVASKLTQDKIKAELKELNKVINTIWN